MKRNKRKEMQNNWKWNQKVLSFLHASRRKVLPQMVKLAMTTRMKSKPE